MHAFGLPWLLGPPGSSLGCLETVRSELAFHRMSRRCNLDARHEWGGRWSGTGVCVCVNIIKIHCVCMVCSEASSRKEEVVLRMALVGWIKGSSQGSKTLCQTEPPRRSGRRE